MHSFRNYEAIPGILSDSRSISHAFPSDSSLLCWGLDPLSLTSVMDFRSLAPASTGSVELLEFAWPPFSGEDGQKTCACYVLLTREDGFLLCLPNHFFEQEELSAHGADATPVDLWAHRVIQASPVALGVADTQIPALLLDMLASSAALLSPLSTWMCSKVCISSRTILLGTR